MFDGANWVLMGRIGDLWVWSDLMTTTFWSSSPSAGICVLVKLEREMQCSDSQIRERERYEMGIEIGKEVWGDGLNVEVA